MSLKKKDFFGKTVADVISQACEALQTPQENLDIEVVETGSSGIFGFIRKKAHIRAGVKEAVLGAGTKKKPPKAVAQPVPAQQEPAPAAQQPLPQKPILREETFQEEVQNGDEDEDDLPAAASTEEPLSQESIDGVRQELSQLLQLMGLPSKIEVEAQGSSVRCHVSGDFEEELTGQEGKILDSLQYLLRKIIARKISERVRISIDVGDYREKRQDELEDQARELAALVKADGKTQVIPSLNPSERRVVHMTLQDDKEIRSRSVGDGLFKKVLIYKPGNAKSGSSRKRSQSRGRRGKGSKPTSDNGEKE